MALNLYTLLHFILAGSRKGFLYEHHQGAGEEQLLSVWTYTCLLRCDTNISHGKRVGSV